MDYRIAESGHILRIADRTFIPLDIANVDYQQYIAWRSEGNVPRPTTGEAIGFSAVS